MPYKDPIKRLHYWKERNKRDYADGKYKARSIKRLKEWSLKNKTKELERLKNKQERYRNRIKLEVLFHYSNGVLPRCYCCGEIGLDFLTLDHVNNDGAAHRKELKADSRRTLTGRNMYKWAKENDFPPKFQVACLNCNWARSMKRNKGVCPHQL